jgi:hypothetical protein
MAGHSAPKARVNALLPGHPRRSHFLPSIFGSSGFVDFFADRAQTTSTAISPDLSQILCRNAFRGRPGAWSGFRKAISCLNRRRRSAAIASNNSPQDKPSCLL